MSFIVTSSGREHWLGGIAALHPDNTPDIGEIAGSLAQINRFCGHARRPYSVAEHSLLVAEIAREKYAASPAAQLAALMHDAHECITGDVSTPVKQAIGRHWSEFEEPHARLLRRQFGLASSFAAHATLVRACDLIALATERRDLLAWQAGRNEPWPALDRPDQIVEPWPDIYLASHRREHTGWREWRDLFTTRFHELRQAVADQAPRLPASGANVQA